MDVMITVREYGYGEDAVGYPPHGLAEVIQILQETLMEIPPEFRSSAEVDYSPRYEYGESYDRLRIIYERPETAEEQTARITAERATMMKWIEEQEALIRRRKAELEIA
ncbi:hypothetical protein [Rhizobium aethiopicum]|uniref:Uncharacterized protein n=1 Tax=Rhizobium aethiopicum TaxID=1138170 RepID=A0A7W6MJ00_9HYPH|nr:hypothetical protein [Rhizobium aethiopicum]MBB4192822.1 hypothetical protein [Rhizobium aethiopicum]